MTSLVRGAVVQNELEAEIACSLLRGEGIDCFHRPTDMTQGAFDGLVSSGGSREIVVRAGDRERAAQLLEPVED